MAIEAVYFDGETARDHKVAVNLEVSVLRFSGEGVPAQTWTLSGLTATDPPHMGHPLRLAHDSQAGARLSIRNDEFTQQLLTAAPHLKGGFHPKRALRVFFWIIGGLSILAGLIYLTLNFAPQRLAVAEPACPACAWRCSCRSLPPGSTPDRRSSCRSSVRARLAHLP